MITSVALAAVSLEIVEDIMHAGYSRITLPVYELHGKNRLYIILYISVFDLLS